MAWSRRRRKRAAAHARAVRNAEETENTKVQGRPTAFEFMSTVLYLSGNDTADRSGDGA
jgi:hypothetical protein